MSKARLTPDDWLKAGFTALQASGPQALAAEPLARALNTTKGSFYWHFKDVPAFHAALLASWHRTALMALSECLGDSRGSDQRLRQFGHDLLDDQIETSLRAWGQNNRDVCETLQAVDAERLTYLSLLLRELGIRNPDFAQALQATLIGLPQLTGSDRETHQRAFDILVDTVLALNG